MSGILSLLLGRSLCDRYRVESVIATGGMGAVCRAFDLKLERQVAVKVVTAVAPDASEAELLRQRFHREARAAARLRHPNVVTVHDFGTDPAVGIDFLVMELLAGEDLAARMRRAGGPLSVDETVEILREGGMGLAAGHRAGMVHRDVKPANIYLVAEPGGWEVKLLDFGIAQVRAAGGDTMTRLTRFGAPHTPRYASPEQLQGGTGLGPGSDVYSMALTGLEMLSGQYPEGLNTTGDDRAAARAVRRILQARPEVPLRLAAVLRRSLRLDPSMRFADAGQFLDELNEWEAPSSPGAGYASILPSGPPPPPADADDRTEIAPPPGLPGTPPIRAYSTVERPVRMVWQIADSMPGATRKDVVAAAVEQGVAPNTARTQYQAWFEAQRAKEAAAVARPVALPPAGPSAAGPTAEAGPDAPGPIAGKPRRGLRLKPAGWLVIFLLLATLAAAIWAVNDRDPRPRRRAPVEDIRMPPPEPAGGAQLARDEFTRVTGQGYHAGDAAYVVIAGSFTPVEMDQARRMLAAAREAGFEAGLANSAVYPQLLDGWVVVAVGPYADRTGVQSALSAVREHVEPKAFPKRVTIRRP